MLNELEKNGKVAEQITGLKLSNEKRERLKKYTISILGEDYYNLTLDFFRSIWEEHARYKVFMNGRCLNLMYNFYQIEYPNLSENVGKNFYSDTSLLANAKEIADDYKKYNFFPEIIIVDDILVHGRTINAFIAKFTKLVYDFLKQGNIKKDITEIECELLNSMEIRTTVQGDKPLLLSYQYLTKLKCDEEKKDIWTPRRWHELSSRFSVLTDEGYFFNNGNCISIYESDSLPNIHLELAKVLKEMDFKEAKWDKKYDRNIYVKQINDEKGNIYGFYIVRMTQNGIDGKYIISPLVIMSDFTMQELNNYSRLKEYIDYFDEKCTKVRAESLYFLLSYNLLKLICDKASVDAINNYDIDKMSINFRRGRLFEKDKWIKQVLEDKNHLLEFDDMNNLILKATIKSEPLISVGNNSSLETLKNLSNKLQSVLASDGETNEKNAFLEYTKVYNTSLGAPKKPLNNLLNKFFENPNKEILSSSIVEQFMGILVRALDTSAISINVDVNKNGNAACIYRAGRQSIYINPLRYSKYLTTLIMMESDCDFIERQIIDRVYEYYGDNKEICDKLAEFVHMICSSGQRLSDWNINFLGYSLLYENNEMAKDFDEKKQNLIHEAMYNAGEQIREFKCYRKKYPEK